MPANNPGKSALGLSIALSRSESDNNRTKKPGEAFCIEPSRPSDYSRYWCGIAEEYHQSEKISAKKIRRSAPRELLDNLSLRLVFTAQFTKILRQTILHHQR